MSACVVAAVLIVATASPGGPCECQPPSHGENPKVIAIFEEMFQNWPGSGVAEEEAKSKLTASIEQTRQISNQDDELLMQQFFLLYFREMPTFQNEERPVQFLVLLQLLEPSREAYLKALYPYLCSGGDKASLWARRFMTGTYRWTPESEVDLEPHGQVVAEAIRDGVPVPVGLVRDMFERYPCRTLLVLSKVVPELTKIRRDLGWNVAEPVCEERKMSFGVRDQETLAPELKSLAESKKWWVRVWVTEYLKQVPELRDEVLWQRLQEDPCEVVRGRTGVDEKQANGDAESPEK